VHAERVLAKFSLSLAQFASLVSSSGTEGVPVTIEYDHGDRPGLNMESRLALTTSEARGAAHEAFRAIKAAESAYWDAVDAKAPAAERKQLRANLQAAIRNAEPNVEFAARKLTEHAAEVVEKSRADIEAMVATAQGRQVPAEIESPVVVEVSE
jgi:hypothetical protein